MLLSLAIGIAQGAYLLHWFERYTEAGENAIAFENNRGEIARLDEVLTMSARLHAATGDPVWHDRYLRQVEPLKRLLERALGTAANDEAQRAIDQVANSNTALIDLEDKSFLLSTEGRLSEALALLTSPGYERLKAKYQQGLNSALEISRSALQSDVESNQKQLFFAAVVLVASLLFLSELWRRNAASEQRQAARKIEASLEREQRASGLQRQFVSILSHELRTPLAIIDGRAQRLQRRAGEFTVEKICGTGKSICDAVKHLTDLMEGVLNVSRIEEGQFDLCKEAFGLAAMVENVVAGYREVDEGRRIDLALGGLPAEVNGDPRLLNQVISNLVSNALKYSNRDSSVRIEGYIEGQDVVLAVHDEGVGIPSDEIGKLGQRFFRASSSTGIAGTGIGLHFISHLIDLHGGHMDVESTEGVGSSFFVRLPHQPSMRSTSEPASSETVTAALSPALPAH